MKRFRIWLDRRRAAAAKREYDAGFHWVATMLYHKAETPEAMRASCQHSDLPYDAGALAALDLFDRLVAALSRKRHEPEN